jgi:hypothetical protein
MSPWANTKNVRCPLIVEVAESNLLTFRRILMFGGYFSLHLG